MVSYNKLPSVTNDFSEGFSCLCQGRSILGGGWDNNQVALRNVYELDMDEYHPMPPLNEARRSLGACYMDGYLFISGGVGSSYSELDSIEMLKISAAQNGSEWTKCNSTLPYPVDDHTLSSLNGKLILIGGFVSGSGSSNKVWEGTPDFKNNTIAWKKMPSMQKKRSYHFSVVVKNNIFVMGGVDDGEDKVEVFNGKEWITGPSVPSRLSIYYGAQAVVNRKNQIIVCSSNVNNRNVVDGLITFDPENLTFKTYQEHTLREKRRAYFAILQ